MSWFKRESNGAKNPQGEESQHTVKTEGLWLKCEGCREILWKKDLEAHLNTCSKCGYHFRLDARSRLRMLFDDGVYQEQDASLESSDPLNFVDSKSYKERLKATEAATSLKDALVSGDGKTRRASCEHLRDGGEVHRRQHGRGHGREDHAGHRAVD